MIEEGLRKRGGGGWKFTHFTSPGSAPADDVRCQLLRYRLLLIAWGGVAKDFGGSLDF